MAIRFKFRSSAIFDSVDIDGRPSISIGELRSKIISHNKIIQHDFDLVFSDPLTFRDYDDDTMQIPSGSSVIIKRVPAGSAPIVLPIFGSVENLGVKNSNILGEKSGEMDDFDDFGIDLCPVSEEMFPYSDREVDKKNYPNSEKANIVDDRIGCQKLQVSGLSEAISIGHNHSGSGRNVAQERLKPDVKEHMSFKNDLATEHADLPSELKCSLCNTFFKDAVMIPCCQHSFCEKCIRGVLIEKKKCPKCSSCKIRVDDLLPNLSLRQAIDHFLESQNLVFPSENALREYAPDGESGIEARDFSRAVPIGQKRSNIPPSPSANEKGSNQIMEESSCYINNAASSKYMKTDSSYRKNKKLSRKRDGGLECCPSGSQIEGENEGGGISFPAGARYRKVDRACFRCGARDHIDVKDCPFFFSQHTMPQPGNTIYPRGMPGFVPPYWTGTTYAPMGPFNNMYGNPGMLPFNASVVPVAPFGVSPYMSSMYGHVPLSGMPRMEVLAPRVGNRAENPHAHSEVFEFRDSGSRGRLSNEHVMTSKPYGDEDEDFQEDSRHNVPARSHKHKSHMARESSESYSGGNHTRKSWKRHHYDKHLDLDVHPIHDRHGKHSHSSRERRPHLSERSNSGVEDVSNSSSGRYDDGRYNERRISRKHHEGMGQCGSDSSWSRRDRIKEKVCKGRVDYDKKGFDHKRGCQLGSGAEPSSSGDQRKRSKEIDQSFRSRHSRDDAKRARHESRDDRWKLIASDEEWMEGNRHSKRKRIH